MNYNNVQEILAKRKANIDKLQNYLDAGKTLDEKIVKKTLQNIRRGEQQLIDSGYTDFVAINDDGTFNSSKTTSDKNSIEQTIETTEVIDTHNKDIENVEINTENTSASEVASENNNVLETNNLNDSKIIESASVDTTNNVVSASESNTSTSSYENIDIQTSNSEEVNTTMHSPTSSEVSTEIQSEKNEEVMETVNYESAPTTSTVETATDVQQSASKAKTKKKLDKITKNRTEKLGVSIKKSNMNNISKLAKDSGRTPNNVVNVMLETMYDEENEKFNLEFNKKEENKNTSYLIDERFAKAIDVISKRTNLSKSDIFNIILEEALKDYI